MDDTGFGHGTGSSKDGFAEPMDGKGGIGTCPNCTVMMLRVGDAFVPELNTWSMAVTYATDIGASVVNISGGGGLSNPALSREAMQYAYDNDVTIIASNSDLDAFHHNYPNTSQHAISVHAIVYDGQQINTSTTFFNYNTCTNYGAQLMLSIPANGCSSEAAGRSGGLAGLLYAAAKQAGLPAVDKAGVRHLTAEEVRQLLIGTSDNFYDPSDATDPTKYPTMAPQPNGLAFARRFGYGRPNARSAVDAIFAGRLPPEVDIKAPGVVRHDLSGQDADGDGDDALRLARRRAAGGHDASIGSSSGRPASIPATTSSRPSATPRCRRWSATSISRGTSRRWRSTTRCRRRRCFQPDDPANKYIVTLRARAVLHSSNPMLDGVKGESRHAVSIYKDRDLLLPGFPIFLGSSGEGSPKVADLLGDGKREIVFADTGGLVHAIRADGTRAPRLAGEDRDAAVSRRGARQPRQGAGVLRRQRRARSRAQCAGGRDGRHR